MIVQQFMSVRDYDYRAKSHRRLKSVQYSCLLKICNMFWHMCSGSRSEITKNEKFSIRSKNLFRILFGLSKMPESIVQLQKSISWWIFEKKHAMNFLTQFRYTGGGGAQPSFSLTWFEATDVIRWPDYFFSQFGPKWSQNGPWTGRYQS